MILLKFLILFFRQQVVHTDHGPNNGASGGGGVNLDICRGGKEDPTTFFRDGIRKIDFVMVRYVFFRFY